MRGIKIPRVNAFFSPPRPSGRHNLRKETDDDYGWSADTGTRSGAKHRGKGRAKNRDHVPKHGRDSRGYDRDDYTGEHRRGGPPRPPAPQIGQRRAKRGITKGKRQTPADDR